MFYGGSLLSYLILGVTMLLSFGAMAYLKSVYARTSQVPIASGMTGAEAAARILQFANIDDVSIEMGDSFLGDHYDPLNKKLVLSPDNYSGSSAAHVGVAAHECGHALQHQQHYAPLQIRMGAVYSTQFASTGLTVIVIASLFFHILSAYIAIWLISLCFAVLLFFNLITLPVEYDASARAKVVLQQLGIIRPGVEAQAVNDTLNAAGLTYVAALIGTVLNFVYYLSLFSGRSRN